MNVFQKKFFVLFNSILLIFILGACSNSAATEIDNTGPGKERVEIPAEQLEGKYFDLLQQASDEFLQSASFESIMPAEVFEMLTFGAEEDFIIVDVRDVEAFAAGNIQGSINIPYAHSADLNEIKNLPKNKKIITVCYSGHTASQTAALWSMLGYDVVPMEYGMGGWTTVEGLGAPFIGKAFEFDVVQNPVEAKGNFDLPKIENDPVSNVNELIMTQSQKYLATGKGPVIPAPTVLEKIQANATDIFLVDVRKEEHYLKGHVPTAINIPIETLASNENLTKLPTDKQIIIVGYSGHDASIATRVLNQLGYNSVSLHSGMRVWTSDTNVTGTQQIPVMTLGKYPVEKLNYNLDSEAAGASCS